MDRREWLKALACGTAASALPMSNAFGATFPERPVKIIVGFPPGASPDLLGRMAADHLQGRFGQPVIVENRAGAAGNISAEAVASSPADGYTLLLGQSGLTWASWIQPNLKFDPQAFVPISVIASVPFVISVRKDLPVQSVVELVAYARANPGKLLCGTSGIGSPQHLLAELFMSKTDTRMVTVPYKGTSALFPDLIAGRLDILFSAAEGVLPHLTAGRIRTLAVLNEKRLDVAPNIPSSWEGGIQVDGTMWVGLLAPAGTPDAIVRRIADELGSLKENAAVMAKLAAVGNIPRLDGPDPMKRQVVQEHQMWGKVIKDAKIVME